MRLRKVWAALGAVVIVLAVGATSVALATPPSPDGHKVAICHATDSDTNPYILETVDIASSGYLQAGHNDHTGPVWYEGAKDAKVKWGDIIPPYDYGTFHYVALNWVDGEAIWENDCTIVEASPTFEQTQAGETDAVSPSPSFFETVAGLTSPPTDVLAGPTSGPADGAWLLLFALGTLLASIIVLTPARSLRR